MSLEALRKVSGDYADIAAVFAGFAEDLRRKNHDKTGSEDGLVSGHAPLNGIHCMYTEECRM